MYYSAISKIINNNQEQINDLKSNIENLRLSFCRFTQQIIQKKNYYNNEIIDRKNIETFGESFLLRNLDQLEEQNILDIETMVLENLLDNLKLNLISF